jgi:hypothetical protein
MACLRLLTFLPLRPLFSVPFLRFFMARSTYREAPFAYLRAILLLLEQAIIAAAADVSANAGNDRVWTIVPGIGA